MKNVIRAPCITPISVSNKPTNPADEVTTKKVFINLKFDFTPT
jgi:hypothetical protein